MNQDNSRVSDTYVSAVVLVRDHEGRIEPFVAQAVAELGRHYGNYELILVEDGSRDGSRKECMNALAGHDGVRLIEFARNYGDEAAYRAGLDNAIGDVVVTLSIDYDAPAVIPPLVKACVAGSGVVAGVSRQPHPSWLRSCLAQAYRTYLWRALRTDLIPGSAYCWAFSRTAVNALLARTSVPRWLRLNASQLGLSVGIVELSAITTGRCRPRCLFNDILAGLSVALAHSKSLFRGAFATAAIACGILLLWLFICPESALGARQLGIWCSVILFLITIALWLLAELLTRNLQGIFRGASYLIVNEYSSNAMLRNIERRNVTKD